MKYILISSLAFLIGCTSPSASVSKAEDPTSRPKPKAITQMPWQEVVINVERFEDIAPFFTKIGNYDVISQTEKDMVLSAKGADAGHIRLRRIGKAEPARPANARSWDKGCYYSLMMRAKDMPSIIEDAKSLGWTPLTEMAFLEFGPSKLNVIALTHDSGVRVHLYERLTTPLPEGFTPFERISRPFNIMQMAEDRDAGYDFFQQTLGFETFYHGGPTVSKRSEVMPLGIPPELTTTTPYYTAIMTPKADLEYGRIELIDVEGMTGGVNYANRCNNGYTGIMSVRFTVDDIAAVRKDLRARKVKIHNSSTKILTIKSPDGANIEFYTE